MTPESSRSVSCPASGCAAYSAESNCKRLSVSAHNTTGRPLKPENSTHMSSKKELSVSVQNTICSPFEPPTSTHIPSKEITNIENVNDILRDNQVSHSMIPKQPWEDKLVFDEKSMQPPSAGIASTEMQISPLSGEGGTTTWAGGDAVYSTSGVSACPGIATRFVSEAVEPAAAGPDGHAVDSHQSTANAKLDNIPPSSLMATDKLTFVSRISNQDHFLSCLREALSTVPLGSKMEELLNGREQTLHNTGESHTRGLQPEPIGADKKMKVTPDSKRFSSTPKLRQEPATAWADTISSSHSRLTLSRCPSQDHAGGSTIQSNPKATCASSPSEASKSRLMHSTTKSAPPSAEGFGSVDVDKPSEGASGSHGCTCGSDCVFESSSPIAETGSYCDNVSHCAALTEQAARFELARIAALKVKDRTQ